MIIFPPLCHICRVSLVTTMTDCYEKGDDTKEASEEEGKYHEIEVNKLLGDHGNRCFLHRFGRRGRAGAIAGKCRGTRSSWISGIFRDDYRILEGTWSHCHIGAGFPEAQRMGVCRHFL